MGAAAGWLSLPVPVHWLDAGLPLQTLYSDGSRSD